MSNVQKFTGLALQDATTLTIASGVVTQTQQYHVLAAEAGTSDTVDTITLSYRNLVPEGVTFRPLLLLYADAGDTITLSHGTGNLELPDDTDIILSGNIGVWLFWRGSAWYSLGAASGGGVTDHGALTGLADDDHTQYALLAGRAGDTLTLADDATDSPLNMTARSAVPTNILANDLYLDDGTNTNSGKLALIHRNDTNSANQELGSFLPHASRSGLRLHRLAAGQILVEPGAVEYLGQIYRVDTPTVLDLSTADDWASGSVDEAASIPISVYMRTDSASAVLKLHNQLPMGNLGTIADSTKFVAAMQVNQAGWDGTAGSGLDATSIIYDNGSSDTDVTPGMLLLVYSDSAYTTGRGKGSAAAAGVGHLSIARITAIDTGTTTLTVDAGHQIAINDDDYLIVAQAEPILYRDIANIVHHPYRWLGCFWNDGSSNLTENSNSAGQYTLNEGSDYTTTSATMVAVDSTNLNVSLVTNGGSVVVDFTGTALNNGGVGAFTKYDILLDGSLLAGDDGCISVPTISGSVPNTFSLHREIALLPGTHNFQLYWNRGSTSTGYLYAGAGTANKDIHSQFAVQELP